MHQSFCVSPFASPSFFHFTFVNVSNFYFVCSTLQSLLYKNICSISIFFSNKLFSILILRIRRSKISKSWKSSPIVDTYLYGLSYRSCIRTCSPLAIFSNVSSLGILPLHSFPIVDFGTPVRIDTCRRDRFFLKMMSAINIFMQTVSAELKKLFQLFYGASK